MGKGWEDLQEGIVFLQQLLFLLLQLVLTFFWGGPGAGMGLDAQRKSWAK